MISYISGTCIALLLHAFSGRSITLMSLSAVSSSLAAIALFVPAIHWVPREFPPTMLENSAEATFLSLILRGRLIIAAASFTLACVMICALLHRLLWPLISRVLYSLERFQVIRQHGVLGTIAIALLFDAGRHSVVVAWTEGLLTHF